MAKLTVAAQMPDSASVYAFTTDLTLRMHSSALMRLEDTSGYSLVLKGKGLVYDGADLVGGKIETISLFNTEGTLCMSVTGSVLQADNLFSTSLGVWGLDVVQKAMSGNDKAIGSIGDDFLFGGAGRDTLLGKAGDDVIQGGLGNDRMTGGNGADSFLKEFEVDHDVITDFQSEGDLALHDQITTYVGGWEVRKSGRDTIVEFSNGSTITLLDFKPSQLDDGDIYYIDL